MQGAPLRILFAAPAWWPAVAFGGPIPVTRELTERLAAHGHEVSVVTTTLVDLHSRPSSQTRTETHGGVRVTYLSTPISYRWMGITPSLPLALERLERPDVVHVLGFRDPISTGVAAWAWLRRIPYVFEPLGMFEPRLRKVPLKRALDATLYRGVAGGAAAVVVSSEREAGHVRNGGVHVDRVRVRGNGFPDPDSMPEGRGVLRGELGIPEAAPIALYAGRIASGKGIDHLLAAARELTDLHLVLVGPDDRHGMIDQVRAAETTGRVHTLEPDGGAAAPPVPRRGRALPALGRRELRHGRRRSRRCRNAGRRHRPVRHRQLLPGRGSARRSLLGSGSDRRVAASAHGRGAARARSPPAASLRRGATPGST